MPQRSQGIRKLHSKSKTGCQACKSRKVKCDEHRPMCRNCLRRGIICDFKSAEPATPDHAASTLTILDMELLHNYSVFTAVTFAADPDVTELWRVNIPRLGLRTPFILNGILALSALHLARSDEHRREMLHSKASECLTDSLKDALPLITNITHDNCDQIFVFAILTLYIDLASPKRADDMLLVGTIPQWLLLLRGIIPLYEDHADQIQASPFALLVCTTDFNDDVWKSRVPAEFEFLNRLEAGLRSRSAHDEHKQIVLLQAVHDLRRSFSYFDTTGMLNESKSRGFYTWLFEISDDYLALLKDADFDALCVFAFYVVLIREFERHWWAEGWAIHLIRRIYYILDAEHRIYIRWPITQLGWVPPAP